MKLTRIAFACALALLSVTAAAQTVIRPVPIPDTSKLPKQEADQLVETRAAFDESKPKLTGGQLAQAYALLASSYALAGFYDASDVALANASVVMPDDGRWIYLRGLLARLSGKAVPARDFFEQALRLDRRYPPIRVAVIEARLAAGDVDAARQAVDQAGPDAKDNAMIAYLRATVAHRQERQADALAAVNDALRLEPGANALYTLQADIYAAQGKSAEAAAARAKAGNVQVRQLDTLGAGFLGATAIDPTLHPAAGTPAAKPVDDKDPVNLARFLISTRQFDAARTPLEQALKREPASSGLLSLSARVEALVGNQKLAAQRADEAVRLSPKDAAAVTTRGVVAETAGNETAAQADYEKAISLDAAQIEARLLLGNRYMRSARYAQAAEQYRQLIRLEPKALEHYARLVAAQSADGRCAEALKELDTGMRAQPQRGGYLTQVFSRLASTCRAATVTERGMALDYTTKLYKERLTPQVIEAYALANAANGKFVEAAELQGSAMFAAVRDGGNEAAEPFREFFKAFQAKQLPDKPWPAEYGYFKPARLQPLPPAKAVAPASGKAQ
jgi:tetratricopeptide (TPR) repeat protein